MPDFDAMRPHLQYLALFHQFKRFLAAAHARGVEVAPLKGAHLLTTVYSGSEHRGMLADLDFLVRPEALGAACQILEEQGFVRRAGPSGRPVTVRTFHELGYFHHRAGVLFEPHIALAQPARHRIDYEGLWARSAPSTFEGVPCRRLTAEDHFLHGAVHLMSHRFIQPGRSLRDLELLVRRGAVDLAVVVSRARQWEAARATWLALTLLGDQAPDLALAARARALRPPPHVRVLLRALVPDARGLRVAQDSLRQSEAVLWPLLFDSGRQALRFTVDYLQLRVRDRLSG